MPIAGFKSIINAAFNVYSSFFFIYSLVPSIGSINQKFLDLFLVFRFIVSSEIIGISGVKSFIFSLKILSTAKSPSVTGDLSDLIVIFTPLSLISLAIFPAFKNVSIRFSIVFFKFISYFYFICKI